MSERNYWQRMQRRSMSRRSLLKASARAGVGAAGLALVGCGGDDDDDDQAAAQAQQQQQATQQEQAQQQAEQQAMQQEQQEQQQAAVAQAEQQEQQQQTAQATDGPRRGGTLQHSWFEDPQGGFDPHIGITGGDALGYWVHIYDRLLGFDDQARVIPMLASAIEIPDDVTYLFTMRDSAIFQDGAPVDANAVQLNMERIRDVKDLAGGTRNRGGIQYADFFEATDDSTWKLVNGEPFGPTLAFFQQFPGTGLLISPEHFDTAVTNPVGAGHLKHVVHEPGERWVGERWDGYWDNDNVHLDGFVQNIIPDQNTAWNAFLNGDIDIDAPTGGVNSDLQAELEADGMKVIRGTAQTWTQTWFNLNPNAPTGDLPFNAFRDPRMRHAYNRALDRQAINEVAWEGLGAPSRAPVSVESWALAKDANYYPEHDLQVAHELMDAAGYGDGIEGIHLSYIAEFQTVVTEPVNSQMRNAGMEMEYIKGTEAEIIPRLLATQDWTIGTLSWESPFDPDPVLRPSFEGLQNWMYGSPEGGPRTGRASTADYPNDQVLANLNATEQLVWDAAVPASQDDRVPLYEKVWEAEEEHMWFPYIAQWPANWVAQPHVENFEIIPFFGFPKGMSFKGIWFNNV